MDRHQLGEKGMKDDNLMVPCFLNFSFSSNFISDKPDVNTVT